MFGNTWFGSESLTLPGDVFCQFVFGGLFGGRGYPFGALLFEWDITSE